MDFEEAAIAVLKDEGGGPLHWTVIQDLALKKGYLDPFIQKDIRKNLLAALALASAEDSIIKESKGVYRLKVEPSP